MSLNNHTENDKEAIEEKFQTDEGKHWPQILAVLIISLAAITQGLIYSWPSPYSLAITQDKVNYDISEEEASYFIVFHPLGMIIGSLFFFKLQDLFGSKWSVIFLAVPEISWWVMTIFAKRKWEFYIAKLIAGIGDTVFFCSVPAFIGEISVPEVRGFWGNAPSVLYISGCFFITVIGSFISVRLTAYICLGIPVIFVLLVILLPESPYQLIKDGQYEVAKKSIQWYRRKNYIEDDFVSMKADVERQISEAGTWKDLFTIRSNLKALRAAVFMRFSQQFSGNGLFLTYSQMIFKKAGGDISPQNASMIFIGITAVLYMSLSKTAEMFGRRKALFYSQLGCGISLISVAIYFLLEQYKILPTENINWFPLAGLLACNVTFSGGLAIVPSLMLGELFSASIKPKGLAVHVTSFGLAIFLSVNSFHLLTANIGLYAPFLLFGISCFISMALTMFWVPETKGKTLEEIQQSLKK